MSSAKVYMISRSTYHSSSAFLETSPDYLFPCLRLYPYVIRPFSVRMGFPSIKRKNAVEVVVLRNCISRPKIDGLFWTPSLYLYANVDSRKLILDGLEL